MALVNKPDESIFASSAKQGEVDNFPDLLRGWGITFDQTQGIPPMEWFNFLFKRLDEKHTYLMQRGLPEWSATQDYTKGSCVQFEGVSYRALKDSKNNSPNESESQYWVRWGFTLSEIAQATLTQYGITKLYTGYDSQSEDLALTPKTAYQLKQFIDSNTRSLGNVIPNSKKSSAVDSNSADTVATSAAVKTAYDKGVEAKTAADNANSNANGRVSKSGDTMTGNFSIKNGDWSGINLFNLANKYTRLEVSPDSSKELLTIVYRNESDQNQSVVTIPKKNGEMLLNTDITSSLSNNGWCKLPNGLILQWGKITLPDLTNEQTGVCTLPVTFPHAVFAIIMGSVAGSTSHGSGAQEGFSIKMQTTSNFTWVSSWESRNKDAFNNAPAQWIAIGY